MKRDMDLARWILMQIEKQPSFSDPIELEQDDYSPETVSYHLMLLHEAGLIVAIDLSGSNDINWLPSRLTWQGHEFLEVSKDNTRWSKVKDIMAQGGGFVFEVAKSVLIQLAQEQVKHLLP